MAGNGFRLYKAPGPPGRYYGYVTLDGVEYKIDAKSVGAKREKHIVGTVKRNLKADQREMFAPPNGRPPKVSVGAQLGEIVNQAISDQVDRAITSLADPGRVRGAQAEHFDFDDDVAKVPF